jgi:hypothetical protein
LSTHTDETFGKILETFSLEGLPRPADLPSLAANWGVVSVEHRQISSDAMLVPSAAGYKVVLKEATSAGEKVRQRFSFAHELGHLLLQRTGRGDGSESKAMHRGRGNSDGEERLCDKLAAEILMPRTAFVADASETRWSLGSLGSLARLYNTSVTATARRMVDLMPEPCVMGVWKPATDHLLNHLLQQNYSAHSRYGIPSPSRLPRQRMWLVARAANGHETQEGIAPLIDKSRPAAVPPDVPAEAWSWGLPERRQVMVYYYPTRRLTDEMAAISKAIR